MWFSPPLCVIYIPQEPGTEPYPICLRTRHWTRRLLKVKEHNQYSIRWLHTTALASLADAYCVCVFGIAKTFQRHLWVHLAEGAKFFSIIISLFNCINSFDVRCSTTTNWISPPCLLAQTGTLKQRTSDHGAIWSRFWDQGSEIDNLSVHHAIFFRLEAEPTKVYTKRGRMSQWMRAITLRYCVKSSTGVCYALQCWEYHTAYRMITKRYLYCSYRITYIHTFSLLTLQPCAGLGLLHGFVTVNISGLGSLAQPPTWRTRDYTLSGPYPLTCLAWVALPGAYALRVIGARKPPLQDKAVLL
jgi:hypothetical protein